MSIPLVVNGTTFNYPSPGEDSGLWGEDATGFAVEVASVLSTLLAPGDILQTTFTVANNVAVASNINGLLFDSSQVRAANITYSVYRKTDSFTSGNTESGTIYINYDNNASSGNKWKIYQQTNGNAGIVFSILDSGQFQYTSTDITGANYIGDMRFSAKTLSS
jgi:hypothetical protein